MPLSTGIQGTIDGFPLCRISSSLFMHCLIIAVVVSMYYQAWLFIHVQLITFQCRSCSHGFNVTHQVINLHLRLQALLSSLCQLMAIVHCIILEFSDLKAYPVMVAGFSRSIVRETRLMSVYP